MADPGQIITGILGAGGILGGLAALWQARNSRRQGIAGDEREARRDEAAQRRDTVADRDALIDQLQEDVAALRDAAKDTSSRLAALEREHAIEQKHNALLIAHIYAGSPPPPPARPTSL